MTHFEGFLTQNYSNGDLVLTLRGLYCVCYYGIYAFILEQFIDFVDDLLINTLKQISSRAFSH